MKKGQGISMNVIIIAAIALLVLVVLIAIFSGRMGVFGQDLNQADAEREQQVDDLADKFGTRLPVCREDCPSGYEKVNEASAKCVPECDDGEDCCHPKD